MKSMKLILAIIAAAAITSAAAYADDENGGPCYVLIMKHVNGQTIPLYHYVQPTLSVYYGHPEIDPNTMTPVETGPSPAALEDTTAPYSIQLNANPHGQQFFLYRNNYGM